LFGVDDLGQKATSLNSDTSGENQATQTENDVENPDDVELKTENRWSKASHWCGIV